MASTVRAQDWTERKRRLAPLSKKAPHVIDQRGRRFHRREMPAFGHDRPVLQVIIALRRLTRRKGQLHAEDRDAGRSLDQRDAIVRRRPWHMGTLIIVARRGMISLRHPI